jgi:hypothetical protein
MRPNIPVATSKSVLLKNMFNPEEETERDWDVELREDVKGEVESKYGKVSEIFVEKESAVRERGSLCRGESREIPKLNTHAGSTGRNLHSIRRFGIGQQSYHRTARSLVVRGLFCPVLCV